MPRTTIDHGIARERLEVVIVSESKVCKYLGRLLGAKDLQAYSDAIDAYWTWGDTDYTLIDANIFLHRIGEAVEDQDVMKLLVTQLDGVDYVNLEG